MFITALFLKAPKWEQLTYTSNDEWINKMRYIHTVEYYSAIKRSEVLIDVTIWMDLQNIRLNE